MPVTETAETTQTTDPLRTLDTIGGRASSDPEAFATGRFEACATHRGAHVDGPCDVCGWLAADHTAGLAAVIEVTPATDPRPLRRAS